MNHKRRRAPHQRAGCKMGKPWKDERWTKGYDSQLASEARRDLGLDAELAAYADDGLPEEEGGVAVARYYLTLLEGAAGWFATGLENQG